MSLLELSKYSADQQRKIDKLRESPGPFSTSGHAVAAWGRFRDSLWGKDPDSLEKQKRVPRTTGHYPQRIPNIYLSLTVPGTMPDVMDLDGSEFLVRGEYEEAEQAALSADASGVKAFLVTGQPGIGKSVFLIRVLMHRLARKLPTALQVSTDYAILFHEGGTLEFTSLTHVTPYEGLSSSPQSCDRIWALVDLDRVLHLPQPAEIFTKSGPFFTVAAVSPYEKFSDWVSKAQHFYMKPWSLSEVLQASVNLSFGVLQHLLENSTLNYSSDHSDYLSFQFILSYRTTSISVDQLYFRWT